MASSDRRMMARVALCSAWIALLGCERELPIAQPTPALVIDNLFFVPTSFEDRDAVHLLVDTGAPLTVAAPDVVGALQPGEVSVDSIELAGVRFDDHRVIADHLLDGQIGGTRLAGIAGGEVLIEYPILFDYRGATFAIGEGDPPSDTDAANDIDADVRGGGPSLYPTTDGALHEIELEPTRMIVEATIEGRSVRLLVDTGASSTILHSSIGEELIADGRGRLQRTVGGMFGVSVAEMYRVEAIDVDGSTVDGAIVMHVPAFDGFIDAVGTEAGVPIDGVLGGTFFREFHTAVDYGASKLVLARYTTLDHVLDEGITIGATFLYPAIPSGTLDEGLYVDSVIAGTDADAQGMIAGELVVAIDGVLLDGSPAASAELALRGPLGGTHTLTFACPSEEPSCGMFEGDRTIEIDHDRLALP